MRRRCRVVKDFCNKLSLLGHKFDTLSQQTALKQFKLFSDNKNTAHQLQKTHSSMQLNQTLHALYIRTLSLHLNKLKNNHQRLQRQDAKLKSVLGTAFSRYQRSCFMRWRDNTHYLATVEDVNLQGPVVEEVLDA